MPLHPEYAVCWKYLLNTMSITIQMKTYFSPTIWSKGKLVSPRHYFNSVSYIMFSLHLRKFAKILRSFVSAVFETLTWAAYINEIK